MKRRYVIAITTAVIVVLLEFLTAPFLLSGASPIVQHVFYTPMMLGEDFLLFAREHWNWPIPSGEFSPLNSRWGSALLRLNSLCNAILGFGLGLGLDGFLRWKRNRKQRKAF